MWGSRLCRSVFDSAVVTTTLARARALLSFRGDPAVRAAWQAWRACDIDGARLRAHDLLGHASSPQRGTATDEARHILTLAAVALGSAERTGLTAFVVSNRTWRQFGDWSRLDVTALLSHAFFKAYTWTLDFGEQVYWLHEAAPQ